MILNFDSVEMTWIIFNWTVMHSLKIVLIFELAQYEKLN